MNELTKICERLEGYSSDTIGFEVLSAQYDEEKNTWDLEVKSYKKPSEKE